MDQLNIVELAALISENTSKISQYLVDNALPEPSFAIDGPTKSPILPTSKELSDARNIVIDATAQLRAMVLGPFDYLTGFIHNEMSSIRAISRFGIAKSFGVGEETTFADIGSKCGMSEVDARLFMRQALGKRIFTEVRPGVIAHNAVSKLWVENHAVSQYMASMSDELWPAAVHNIDAMMKWPGSEEPNQCGFSLANSTDDIIYKYLDAHPERAKQFADAMGSMTTGPAYDSVHVIDGYDWAGLGNATVVGGSNGDISKALVSKFANLNCISEDLNYVVEGAPKYCGPGAERLELKAHDFFEVQPVENADVYLYRWILHNWSDKYCMRILRGLIPALKPGARLIINDTVLPDPGTLPRWREDRLRSIDICMKELHNAHERDLNDWKKLLQQADPRFQFKDAHQPLGSVLWIIEAVWAPEQI